MSNVEKLHFYSEGVRLAADLYISSNATTETPAPGVVLCHGYTGGKNLYLPDTASALNEAGFFALGFDYKGWGERDGPKHRLGPHGRVADFQAAVTYKTTRPEIDPEKIGL